MRQSSPSSEANLASLLSQGASLYEGRPLLRHNGASLTHAELGRQVDRLAGYLRGAGLRPGDRLLLLAANKPEWLAALFAGLRLGAIVVPVNPALAAPEIAYIVEHAAPTVAVVDAGLEPLVPARADLARLRLPGDWPQVLDAPPETAVHPCGERDPAIMFYTSGTTGRPKGALLGHGAERFTAEMVASHFRIGPGDVSLIASPLSFIYPLVIDCLACLRAGATVVLQERFHPGLALRGIESERATLFMGVPTMFTMMLEWAEGREVDVSSLRFCISAGQNLPWHVARRFHERFGVVVYDLWGQTEGTPITSYDPAVEREGRPESCGRPLPGCAVRVVDDAGGDVPADAVGEVLLSSPSVMLGYYANPAATAETLRGGWIHTGDLGKLDADGYLYIVGRKRDLIIRGGANVYPIEVEEALYAHSDVLECAVVGVADERYGERVRAFVVRKPGAGASDTALLAHCRERLAEYKLPSEVVFLEALPKGPTGKILKRELRG